MPYFDVLRVPAELLDFAASERLLAAMKKRKTDQPGVPLRVLTLTGPTGTGKTCDGVALMIYQAQKRGVMRSQVGFLSALSLPNFDRDELREAMELKMLLIDEVGARMTPGAQSRTLEIVNTRLQRGLITTLTGNIGKQSGLDERLLSRMRGGFVVSYEGLPDLRKDQGAVARLGAE